MKFVHCVLGIFVVIGIICVFGYGWWALALTVMGLDNMNPFPTAPTI